jgi:methylglyoxal synthase
VKATALRSHEAPGAFFVLRNERERVENAGKILIAEDDTVVRLDLCDTLARAGFDVCAEAADGVEAVALARSTAPDVALLDVKMPRLSGIDAARQIISERPIPVVLLTAYGQDELVTRAVDVGVAGYLTKPFREGDLIAAIRTARGRAGETPEPPRMQIALVAHDGKKDELLALVGERLPLLQEARLIATETTGRLIEESYPLTTARSASGPEGGDLQIGALVAKGGIDLVVFLRDPLAAHPHEPDIQALMKVCDVYRVPLATNAATAALCLDSLARG